MRNNNKMRFMPMILIVMLVTMLVAPMTASFVYAAQETVDLGTASSFGILAGSAITNTGTTSVGGSAGGDIGVHPTGTFTGDETVTKSGDIHLADAVALQAKADLVIAYDDVAERIPVDQTIFEITNDTLLTPGVYRSGSSIQITGRLILDAGGDPDAVFIFQAVSDLITASGSEIVLVNGAQACHVFWQVGSSATLGTDSFFKGSILALTSITVNSNAVIEGRLLARNGAVTLASNTITNELCLGSLSVTKVVVDGPVNGINLPDFVITVTGVDNVYSETETIAAGTSYTWKGLEAGTYTVSEEGLGEEWGVSGTGVPRNVVLGDTTNVTITNTYTPADVPSNGSDDDSSNDSDDQSYGELTVTKVVSGDIGDMTLPDFEITVTGPGDFSETRTFDQAESYTWDNLETGVYTVTESRTGLSSEWRVSGEGTVRVRANQTAIKTITNAYLEEDEPTGELTVTKVVSGDISDMTLPLFGITVTGPRGFLATRTFDHGESYTWENLVPGAYTVTESRSGLSSEWTVSGEGLVQVTADQTALTTITNAYIEDELSVGALTVTKVVSGDTAGMTLPLFGITVTGPGGFSATRTFLQGESFTWENLVPGVYNVTESRTGLSTEWTVNGEGTIQVTADQIALKTITNGYGEALVLGIVELPQTGGYDLLTIYLGFILLGIGLLVRPNKQI